MNQVAPQSEGIANGRTLYVAMELSAKEWRLGMSAGELPMSEKRVAAEDLAALSKAVEWGRAKFGVERCGRVVSCYEAGRDGFWLHRALEAMGVENRVVDPSSLEVDRRQRRVKTDRIDVRKLLNALVRLERGEKVLRVVKVPTKEEEDLRRLERERGRLTAEQTAHKSRVRSLLALHGIRVKQVSSALMGKVEQLRRSGSKEGLPECMGEEIERELERLHLVEEQLAALLKGREEKLKGGPLWEKVTQLTLLKGIGNTFASFLVLELFGWREFKNRRQVGAITGLTPSPYNSGESRRDQGISKAGSRRIRAMGIELAWTWVRFQPHSKLSRWFWERFGRGGGRLRRIGIVALTRRLIVALWRYVDFGVIPDGALMKGEA